MRVMPPQAHLEEVAGCLCVAVAESLRAPVSTHQGQEAQHLGLGCSFRQAGRAEPRVLGSRRRKGEAAEAAPKVAVGVAQLGRRAKESQARAHPWMADD